MKKYLVFDIGCIECGEESQPVGLFNTEKEAQEAKDKYVTDEPNEFGISWGRKEWNGQHSVKLFPIETE